MAQSAPVTAQTIEAYVGETMDAARMGPVHWQVLALVASGYFFDVLDFTIFWRWRFSETSRSWRQ